MSVEEDATNAWRGLGQGGDEMDRWKPQPMSQQCRARQHGGTCRNCRCLCHFLEPKVVQLRAELSTARGRVQRHDAAAAALRTIVGGGPLPEEWSTSWQERAKRGEARAARLRAGVESALRLLGQHDHAAAEDLLRSLLQPPPRSGPGQYQDRRHGR